MAPPIDGLTFQEEVTRAGAEISPARAALLFARECAYPDLRPSHYLVRLDDLAQIVEPELLRLPTAAMRAGALAEFLFREQGYRGNIHDYADPRNSYLNQVFDRRLGLPISLSVIYLEVGWRLGLSVQGIGLPAHFIVALTDAINDPVYFDPFHAGRRLTAADCAQLVQRLTGEEAFDWRWLTPVAPRLIVARMLSNLRNVYVELEDWPHAISIVERLGELQPEVAEHCRDLGLLHYRNASLRQARSLLTEYLIRKPQALDAESVRQGRDRILEQWAKLN